MRASITTSLWLDRSMTLVVSCCAGASPGSRNPAINVNALTQPRIAQQLEIARRGLDIGAQTLVTQRGLGVGTPALDLEQRVELGDLEGRATVEASIGDGERQRHGARPGRE